MTQFINTMPWWLPFVAFALVVVLIIASFLGCALYAMAVDWATREEGTTNGTAPIRLPGQAPMRDPGADLRVSASTEDGHDQ